MTLLDDKTRPRCERKLGCFRSSGVGGRRLAIAALLVAAAASSAAEQFTLGYLTGSQRKSGDLSYDRPGLTISGAITLAVNEVNEQLLGPMGHELKFEVAETYGQEEISIRQVASLWARNISAYIGPQETCVHEGRMAAAFNLPMVSYFCTEHEASDKRAFPTFARTRPPDTQISKSVAAVLLHFRWTHVSFLYLHATQHDFSKVGTSVLGALRACGVRVQHVRAWHAPYHHGYSTNPFKDIVAETYKDTRVYVSLGYYHDHIGLVLAMDEMKLFEKGEYQVVGVDLETYADEREASRYLRGPLRDVADVRALAAFRSYLAVAPSAARNLANFTRAVNRYLEMSPFNYPNPLARLGGGKAIRAEAAYLYDAVWLYARALAASLLDEEERAEQGVENEERLVSDGAALARRMRDTHYLSAMGYMVYMDANGDAEGNYTLLGLRGDGLRPLGVLARGNNAAADPKDLPELQLLHEIAWVGGHPPAAEPPCGFLGEKCARHGGEIIAGVVGGAFAALALAAAALYRSWRYEQELDSLLWKLDYREIKAGAETRGPKEDVQHKNKGQVQLPGLHPLVRTSQASLSSNPDAEFRYCAAWTELGVYRGRALAIKRVRKHALDITRDMKKELKVMRDLRHDNLNGFVGACTEPPNICIVMEYCARGSLKDILENEDVKLDSMFIASLVGDIIRGMLYLHESPIQFHGALRPSNCLVDSRWVVKLTDFGLRRFRAGEEPSTEPAVLKAQMEARLYLAPELLRSWTGTPGVWASTPGTPAGDVYAFALVLYELHTRRGPWGTISTNNTSAPITAHDIVLKVAETLPPGSAPFRPSLEPLEGSFDFVRDCLRECWAEEASTRPDFKAVRTKLRPLRKGMKANIFDNMMAMMEKYANNLEALVDARTDQLQEEKKKTEALLLEMLPRPVAEQLMRGRRVDPESFDCVTIYFSDIVGFTQMSSDSTPLEIVDFLNDLYTCFDSIIENYDVYKVETIGDAYMVVSGLPVRNGVAHAGHAASMALALLRAVRRFRVRHRPALQLQLRVGLHSGPVCAGVVGLKMPRYCLFGDTVNTASRMESTGEPLKIHCSSECKSLLDAVGGYRCSERGVVRMKGKSDRVTYWLLGERQREHEYEPRGRPPRQRSSLKTKPAPRGMAALHRCSSLESPKKLRFAAGTLLECFDYNPTAHRSDEYLMEVSSECQNGTCETSGLTAPTECVHASSCPCIEACSYAPSDPLIIQPSLPSIIQNIPISFIPNLTPAVVKHTLPSTTQLSASSNIQDDTHVIHVFGDDALEQPPPYNTSSNAKACEIKLTVNGFEVCDDGVGPDTPLLGRNSSNLR